VNRDSDPHEDTAGASAAVDAAVREAGPNRHVLVAAMAVRLASLGHVREVRIKVAGGAEAAEAVRSVLAELRADKAQTTPEAGPFPLPGQGAPTAEGTLPEASETIPVGGSSRPDVAILAILASGPVSGRALAGRLHLRSATVSRLLRDLEREGCVARTRKTGRGARWALQAPTP